jgi:hypothetical protein
MDNARDPIEDFVMNRRCCWDTNDRNQVEEAKQWFVSYKRKGVPIQDADGKPVQFFRPHYGELVALATPAHAGKRVMKILCEKGDERVVWDRDKGKEAKEAKEKFLELVKKGYSAYSVDSKGRKNRRIEEFDVEAEEILMIPPTAKG